MPQDSVKFITKFTTFTDEMVPYMYHCHLLHHEDDGMMGSFLVYDPFAGINDVTENSTFVAFPNPSSEEWNITGEWGNAGFSLELTDAHGKIVLTDNYSNLPSKESVRIPNSILRSVCEHFLWKVDLNNNQLGRSYH